MFPLSPQATHMADFSHIQSIQTVFPPDNCSDNSATLLRLRVAGSSELLTVSCPTATAAENMAELIDGYCRLVNGSHTSIWDRKGEEKRMIAAALKTPAAIKSLLFSNNQLSKWTRVCLLLHY